MGSGRKAGSLVLALYGAFALLLPLAHAGARFNCLAHRDEALKHFRDELKLPGDRAKAMETFRQKCSRSLTASFDQFAEKESYCKAGWWKIFWALEDYGNSLDYGCTKTTVAMAKCDSKTMSDEELSNCVREIAQKASEADKSAKALLEGRIEEAQEIIRLATEHEKELGEPAPDSKALAPATSGLGLRRFTNAPEIAREQRELRATAARFVELAREENGKRLLADQAFVATAERIRTNTANESSITGPAEKPSSGSKWETLNDSLKLGSGALMLTTGGIALSRALGGSSGSPPSAAPLSVPASPAAPVSPGAAASVSSIGGSAARTGEASSRSADAKGSSAPVEVQHADAGPSGLSNVHSGSAGFAAAESFSGPAAPNEAGNGARTGGSTRALSSPGADTKLGEHSLASESDEPAGVTKGDSAMKGIGTGVGGGGLGPSHPFMKDGSEPSPRELAGLPKLDFKNDPLSDQEKDLLKLLDGFDDTKANTSPAQAREFLSKQLGGYDPNGDFSSEAAAKGGGALASNGGVPGAESMSLFARVRFAHKRATKRGLIIGLHEEP